MKLPSDLVSFVEKPPKWFYFVSNIKTLKKNLVISVIIGLLSAIGIPAAAQTSGKVQKASKKVQKGFANENVDTLAQGYYDLGETFYQKGELLKSENYFKKSRSLYESQKDAEGTAKSSRALARVQEDLNKNLEAVDNYRKAEINSNILKDKSQATLNRNDVGRLQNADSVELQNKLINANITYGLNTGDTGELAVNYSRMGDINVRGNQIKEAIGAYWNAYEFSRGIPEQAARYNQKITDLYVGQKNYTKAIEAKKEILNENFVATSTELKAQEIASLANIYLLKKEDSTAIRLLKESFELSVKNGHTVQAKECIVKLDSLFQLAGRKDLSLNLYKSFLVRLPEIIAKDSSLMDTKLIAETEFKIRELENEKALKDDLIRRKNVFNYWLMGSLIVLLAFVAIVLYMIRKLRVRNKKIALQSLRREMNPHFIFNSLNSINQFIATRNELEANQYLTRFSVLMRRVMENSKEDFVVLQKELELLTSYLELERSRFPDKFDFKIKVDESLLEMEEVYVPGMLIQPHIENAIWHGLRYLDGKGWLNLEFQKQEEKIRIIIEDNGIGISESAKHKTQNQKKQKGRGIANTHERIRILNELYRTKITCEVEDKPAPDKGVKVMIYIPLLNKIRHEN